MRRPGVGRVHQMVGSVEDALRAGLLSLDLSPTELLVRAASRGWKRSRLAYLAVQVFRAPRSAPQLIALTKPHVRVVRFQGTVVHNRDLAALAA